MDKDVWVKRRVVVIGNAGLDLRLAVPRLPLPGETLVGAAGSRAPGGKGLNQAVVAARCGAAVRFCAPLGNDDAEANEVARHVAKERFVELMLPRLPHPTDFSLIMVLPQGENSIVSTSACSRALTPVQAKRCRWPSMPLERPSSGFAEGCALVER
jgi:ribokinase